MMWTRRRKWRTMMMGRNTEDHTVMYDCRILNYHFILLIQPRAFTPTYHLVRWYV